MYTGVCQAPATSVAWLQNVLLRALCPGNFSSQHLNSGALGPLLDPRIVGVVWCDSQTPL